MEKLLEIAKKVCDKVEVYSIEYKNKTVSFEDAKLHDIDSKFQSGFSLRIIKDGRLGFAYTRNLLKREELLQNALDSLQGGVEADFDFPFTKELPQLDTYDSSVENQSGKEMVDECARICDIFKHKTDGEISATSFLSNESTRIINSKGTDLSQKSSYYVIYGHIVYPGTGAGILRFFPTKKFEKMPQDTIDELIDLYKMSSKTVAPKGERMKVLFMPNCMHTLTWRITRGTSSKSVYEKISPITDKIGEKIFDEKITIKDEPLNDKYPGARSFDDEGVACKPLTIVENGILKSFYYDLNFAKKLNAASTGHGYKPESGDPIAAKPGPALTHLTIKPGNKSFSQLVESIDRGIVLERALGAHSGNIPNGDYSVGVSPGLYVENGEIIGRLKDAMVAGNVYETLKHVVAVGDTLYPFSNGWIPAILCDNVSVSTKG